MRNQLLRFVLLLLSVGALLAMQMAACGPPGVCKCQAGHACIGNKCVPVETAPEATPEVNDPDGGVPTCPKRCKSDRDCVFCGDRKTCDTDDRVCVDLRIQCPKICNQDKDCFRTGCGARTTCNTDINECVERVQQCPDACKTNADCSAGGCGPRSECSKEFGTCVDPTVANCPFNCKDDAGCKDCGERNKCSISTPGATNGICRKFGDHACPSFCRSSGDCYTKGCGEKKFCNYATGVCVTKDQFCPRSCKADADCSPNCGSRTFCYKSSPDRDGYCATPPTAASCPSSCRTSFSCKAKDCADAAYCSPISNTCVDAANACPGSCTTDADCPRDKCGPAVRCRGGRCWAR